jgi:hypothetical protein
VQNLTHTVTGTVTDANTVKLDESLPLHSVKVRVTIEALPASRPNRYWEVMTDIRKRQHARNHQSPTPADVQRFVSEERKSWE